MSDPRLCIKTRRIPERRTVQVSSTAAGQAWLSFTRRAHVRASIPRRSSALVLASLSLQQQSSSTSHTERSPPSHVCLGCSPDLQRVTMQGDVSMGRTAAGGGLTTKMRQTRRGAKAHHMLAHRRCLMTQPCGRLAAQGVDSRTAYQATHAKRPHRLPRCSAAALNAHDYTYSTYTAFNCDQECRPRRSPGSLRTTVHAGRVCFVYWRSRHEVIKVTCCSTSDSRCRASQGK